MKALTICQPYAHLILTGEKPVENRTWPSGYRGPLLIHAGKNRSWLSDGDEDRYPLVFGAVIGQVEMTSCMTAQAFLSTRIHIPSEQLRHINGPWCFELRNPVRFDTPIPWRGQQGFFDVPDTELPSQNHSQ